MGEHKMTTHSTRSHDKANGDISHSLHKSGEEILKGFGDVKKAFTKRVRHQGEEIRDYVNEKPFSALGIAALVGMGLGLLLLRK
jgi:ElaB/YqjD/DUF883 family membrane-anchored ribosome-binding protein